MRVGMLVEGKEMSEAGIKEKDLRLRRGDGQVSFGA